MNKTMLTVILSITGGFVSLIPATSMAADQERSQAQTQKQERIFGSQLMTRKERAEHRAKLRSLKTLEEREAYRLEHHNKMLERAKERGVTLPDEPPAGGMGMMGPGGGMGPGNGMGPGGGRNR
jgi:hypothetical protein